MGSCVMLLVLIVATDSWAVPLAALFSIGMVATTVFGIYGFLDWDLDLNAAISLSIIVPVAADHVARFAYTYVAAPGSLRHERVQYALAASTPPVLFSKA